MNFLADESCDFTIVRALQAAGYNVQAVKDILPGAPDEDVINHALKESCILLTEDKDFGQLVFASAVESPGVILFRFSVNARQAITNTVIEFLRQHPGQVERRFVVIQPGRVRISDSI